MIKYALVFTTNHGSPFDFPKFCVPGELHTPWAVLQHNLPLQIHFAQGFYLHLDVIIRR